jgi:hypothetical protein
MPQDVSVTVSLRKRDILLATITTTADYMARWNVYPSDDADAWITQALKTVGYYERVMWRLVKDLYGEEVSIYAFEEGMLNLISNQYRRAWNEGMRLTGMSPSAITLAMERELQDAMANELNYVRGLVDDVIRARQAGSGFDPFRSRVEMWANRYNDIRNRAKVAAGILLNIKYRWVVGPTEHCSDCAGYDGQVKTAREWDAIFRTTGHRPQAIELECKGFLCACELEIA